MDSGASILIGSLVASVASVVVAGISAWAAVRSGQKSDANYAVLLKIAPQVVKVEKDIGVVKEDIGAVKKQTNHLQDILQEQSTSAGIRIGQDEERKNPTEPGTPSPKLPTGT